jgi:hypothetical protein
VDLQRYKVLFIVVIGVSALLVASPALQQILVLPQTEYFSELMLLGPGHLAEDYPFNITRNEYYSIFLDVGNSMGKCGYYQIQVKFRNETQSKVDVYNRTPSSLSSLYNITAFVANKENWELLTAFSFDYEYIPSSDQIHFNQLIFNGLQLDIHGYSASWNSTNNEFAGTLFFELWIYNDTLNAFQYDARFVSLRLNMTNSL